mgnify:FL=1
MSCYDRGVQQEAADREGKQPGKAVAVALPARPDLKAPADDHQRCRKAQNPDFVGMQESVDGRKSASQQCDARRCARYSGGDHCQRGQATAQRVQADNGRVSQVRVLAGSGAVML